MIVWGLRSGYAGGYDWLGKGTRNGGHRRPRISQERVLPRSRNF